MPLRIGLPVAPSQHLGIRATVKSRAEWGFLSLKAIGGASTGSTLPSHLGFRSKSMCYKCLGVNLGYAGGQL